MLTEEFFGGGLWRRTHQATIDGILGAGVRAVLVDAGTFGNDDAFRLPLLARVVADASPGPLTPERTTAWLATVNAVTAPPEPTIRVAATPDALPPDYAHALVGGGYVEAFRTLYGRTQPLTLASTVDVLSMVWDSERDLRPLSTAVRGLAEVFELTRIRTLGLAAYPGVEARLWALDDLMAGFDTAAPLSDAPGSTEERTALAVRWARARAHLRPGAGATNAARWAGVLPRTFETACLRALESASALGDGGERAHLMPLALAIEVASTIGLAPPVKKRSAPPDEGDAGEPAGQASGPPRKGKVDAPPELQAAGERVPQAVAREGTCVDDALAWGLDRVFGQAGPGEQIYRAPPLEADFVRVAPEGRGIDVAKMRRETSALTTAIRARLRSRFLLARNPIAHHGVRHGIGLSEQRLVDSIIEARSGREPARPDWTWTKARACGLSVALVVDLSGSMVIIQPQVSLAAAAVADALCALRCPVQVVGFSGVDPRAQPEEAVHLAHAHRKNPVRLELFKDWREPMNNAVWSRLGAMTCDGGTPMADGLEWALRGLRGSREPYRVVFVLTDGAPDNEAVVRWQLRSAVEADILVVGVGLDRGARDGVAALFPYHVVVERLADLADGLLGFLERLVFPRPGQSPPPTVEQGRQRDRLLATQIRTSRRRATAADQ